MEGFRIDLKTFLGLVKPNQCFQMSESKYQAGFGVIISGQNPQTFMIYIYSTTVLYDMIVLAHANTYSYPKLPLCYLLFWSTLKFKFIITNILMNVVW